MRLRDNIIEIADYNGQDHSVVEERNAQQDVATSRNVFPIIDVPSLPKMQGLDYKIENEHLYVACNGQSSWHYIGSLRGVIHARIVENNVGGGGAPPVPGNNVMLEINFPERGITSFHIPYNTTAEAAKALNKAEQLVKDLIDFSRKKEMAKEASALKMEQAVQELLIKHTQLYTMLEKQAVAPKCVSGNHD